MKDISFIGSSLTRKPWGSEYLVCTSPSAALWCLTLNHNASTSFHCHPVKRTGYVVVDGAVHIEFLSSGRDLKAGEFINFRPGLFHKTTALTARAVVLEIESPNSKQDLLRLEDSSGRKSSHIEAPDERADRLPELLLKDEFLTVFSKGDVAELFKLRVSLRKVFALNDLGAVADKNSFLMVLEGIVLTNQSYPLDEPQRLLGPGDVISVSNLCRMRPVIELDALDISCILFEAA